MTRGGITYHYLVGCLLGESTKNSGGATLINQQRFINMNFFPAWIYQIGWC